MPKIIKSVSGQYSYTEDTLRGRMASWMNSILKEEEISFEYVDQQIELTLPDSTKRRFPDIVIWKKKLTEPACIIEYKPPEGWTPYDLSLVEEAQKKAIMGSPQIPYFGTWNTNEFVLWKTFDEKATNIWERRKAIYRIVDIRDRREIDKSGVEIKIKSSLREFLKNFEDVYYGKIEIPKIPFDEFVIFTIQSYTSTFFQSISRDIKNKRKVDKDFRDALTHWFIEQQWPPPSTDEDFERVARQFLYLLIDKILFYNTIRMHYKKLKAIEIPDTKSGKELKGKLQEYFNSAVGVTSDYETVFSVDFLEQISIPDEIADRFTSFINSFSKYDFSKLGYRDIGRIYDNLIPVSERHKLGQYFTRPDVVDLINGFCIKNGEEIIGDFGCGAGTFLVRAYARLKTLNPDKEHEQLLNQLWGVDISKFPAHLSVMNLAKMDLSKSANYPNVICKDFFELNPRKRIYSEENELTTLSQTADKEVVFPRHPIDVVVGNPPYTRQEELEDYIKGYKQTLQKVLKRDWGKEGTLGKRAGIYSYFFMHGLKFLTEKGRFGYVTSNSWLNVDYGKYLQELILKKTKIITIIESKVEMWFEEADINTSITILERCGNEKQRNENLIKFVQLKVPLKELILPTDNEKERWNSVDKLVKLIEEHNEFYENEKIKIFPKKQGELCDEGFDEKKREYVGAKWGKYIRAPDIFFKVLEKGKGLFVPLKEIADVRFGIKTGANEFFYLTEEEIKGHGIEKEFWMHPLRKDEDVPILEDVWKDKEGEYFENSQYLDNFPIDEVLRRDCVYWVPNYVIKSPRECKSILVNPKNLKYRVLMIHKDKKGLEDTNILKYIEWGEERGFHKRPTCASRRRWYNLGEREFGDGFWMMTIRDRIGIFKPLSPIYVDARLYDFYIPKDSNIVISFLNSTIIPFLLEQMSRSYGGGGGPIDVKVYEVAQLPIILPESISEEQKELIKKSFSAMMNRQLGTIFEELGAKSPEEFSLEKVRPDRRELDKIVIGEILDLTEEEQLEVYKAVINLVKSRIEKAKSIKRERKPGLPDPEVLTEGVLREIDISDLKSFPDDYIEGCKYTEINVPKGKPEMSSDLQGYFVKVNEERIDCSSSEEAKYIFYAILNYNTKVKIPRFKKDLSKAVKEYNTAYKKVYNQIEGYLKKFIPDRKMRDKLRFMVWEKILRKDKNKKS